MGNSESELPFLDTRVVNKGGRCTDLFVKQTDRNNILRHDSLQPRNMVGSLPYSKLIRVRRIVEDETKVDLRLDEMCRQFIAQGYPPGLICRQRKKSLYVDRRQHLQKHSRQRRCRIPLVSTYSEVSQRLSTILRKDWYLLGSLGDIEEFNSPPLMSFRNLRDRLVRADLGCKRTSITRTGCYPCLSCKNCNNMQKGSFFSHPRSGKRYSIRQFFTCKFDFVIYTLQCPCGLLYVGETTQECRSRIGQHQYTIRQSKMELPVPHHFNTMGHNISQLRFRIMDEVPQLRKGGDRKGKLEKLELKWIYK
ncbi:hypothetical protein PRIEUP_LOCUS94, partial [Pristimantis euphronides]